ncbi:MAG TPA: sigma-70 family RNA polymerase sigma factor [Nannocystaceae bacterium]|nr:sigma-70 family RNA polymerase sigma factor [Nannocystaceae bacterium]
MAEENDYELLAAWRAGDAAAGNRLLRRHFQSVHRFFRNKLDGDIDDLIQRTFLGLVEALPRFEARAQFKTFLLAVARNQLLLHFREQARDKQRDAEDVSVHDLGVSAAPSGYLALREEQRLLLTALRRLPLALQTTVELFYWERMGVDDIGLVLDIPAGTVKSRLARARDGLRQTLQELAAAPQVRDNTLGDLEEWARSLRDVVSALEQV